ncbi:MAG: class I SAM-dependent rRNA methyltransferase [Alphaproteobacteria bacterium]|nr:class I SAM-dependent rRNA methyltransferase [Alphaproteobacteria bacterium]
MAPTAGARAIVRLVQGAGARRARHGHPWVFANEIVMDESARAIAPGAPVALAAPSGEVLGTYLFNPHSLIAARRLARDPAAAFDAALIADRLRRALALRGTLYAAPYYRLVHAEADDLPALAIDRFGDVVVCQLNGAGVERAADALIEAIRAVLAPAAIVLRRDSPARLHERLDQRAPEVIGVLPASLLVIENDCRFVIDACAGQKTGWFFDQRDNRAFMAGLSRGRSVLDTHAYVGGFGIVALRAGAGRLLAIDSSEAARALADEAAALNGVAGAAAFRRGEAFTELARLAREGATFGTVICDPPAFVKSRKTLASGLKGYEKLARLAAQVVEAGGFLFLASCSHAVEAAQFASACVGGIGKAGRTGRILRAAGAAPDHPVHPLLPETAYLKALVFQLD